MMKTWTILGGDRMDESLKAQLQVTLDMIRHSRGLQRHRARFFSSFHAVRTNLGLPKGPLRFGSEPLRAVRGILISVSESDDHDEKCGKSRRTI